MGTHKNRINEAVLMCTHNQCFDQKEGKSYNYKSMVEVLSSILFGIYDKQIHISRYSLASAFIVP